MPTIYHQTFWPLPPSAQHVLCCCSLTRVLAAAVFVPSPHQLFTPQWFEFLGNL
jgi:hypothetical protein